MGRGGAGVRGPAVATQLAARGLEGRFERWQYRPRPVVVFPGGIPLHIEECSLLMTYEERYFRDAVRSWTLSPGARQWSFPHEADPHGAVPRREPMDWLRTLLREGIPIPEAFLRGTMATWPHPVGGLRGREERVRAWGRLWLHHGGPEVAPHVTLWRMALLACFLQEFGGMLHRGHTPEAALRDARMWLELLLFS